MGLKASTVLLVLILLCSVLIFFPTSADTINYNSNPSVGIWKSLNYKLYFSKPSFHEKIMCNNPYHIIDMPGCVLVGKKPGEPAIPVKLIKILLPLGTTVKNINVIGVPVEIDTFAMDLIDKPVAPYQNPVPIGSELPKQLVFDDNIYRSFDVYPFNMYSEQNIGYCRGYTILSFNVNPVQYIPGSGKMFYYPEMMVSIDLEKNNYVNSFFRSDPDDEEWIEKLVYDPEITESYKNGYLPTFDYVGGLCDPLDDYDYVIITTTQNGLDDWETNSSVPYNWSSLISKHESDDGLDCTLVTVEDINACSDYWNDTSLFNDTAAHIREFCKDAYQDWGASYIFVGGDDEWIPAREMDTGFETGIDSDIYWSNLDNTFNDDSDSYWGEEGDSGFDIYAEMYIGRITCDTPQDVSNWMNKSFCYADSVIQDYLDNAVFYAGSTGWYCEGDDFIDYSAVKGTDDWLGPEPGSDGPYPVWLGFQYGFETWNSENPGQEYNLSIKWTAESPNAGWQGGDELTAIEGLKNAINNDQATLISAIAHANEYYSMDVYYTSWESDYHNSKPFFLHDYGCHCGDMDAADDGVLHSMLFHSDAELAFACVYNTGYGWGNFYSTNSSSALQQKLFWDYMFDVANNSGDTMNWQLGKAMAFSKDTMAPTVGWDYSWRSIIQGCLLFGDPAQRIKPPTIFGHNVGVQTLQVSASDLIKPNRLIYVNATIYNNGENNETNVSVSFLINGSEVESTNITSFESYTINQISFNRTLSAGSYNLTINVSIPEIVEDTYSDNEKTESIVVGIKNIDTEELFNTIQNAINDTDTLDGHNILVPCGTYQENIVVSKNLTISGSGKDTTIIESNNFFASIISIQNRNNVNITKFTIGNANYGINVTSSSNISITDSNISNNTVLGINLNISENVTINNNDIYENSIGITLNNHSHDNLITENEFVDNNIGLILEYENNHSSIYHNNFNNTLNSFDNGSNNLWDNGCQEEFRLRGGNWWSNYTGNDSNFDGIGDTPYIVPGLNNSEDRYPLIEPWVGSLSGTIYVNCNNIAGPWYGTQEYPYQLIQDAIDDSLDGDKIFVFNGTYQENIVIDNSINLTGENKNTTIIDANNIGTVVYIDADWVNITGFKIQNSGKYYFDSLDWANLTENNTDDYYAGIIVSSNYVRIYDNIIINNSFGVLWLEELANNNVSYNTFINNSYYDIVIGYSSANKVIGNNLTKNNTYFGISFGYSHDNTITDNIIANHTDYCGIELFSSSNNIVSRNVLTNNFYGICVEFSSNNNILLNYITSSFEGIAIFDSYDNNIIYNNVTNNFYGISLDWSSDNIIYHNNFVDNTYDAYDDFYNYWYNVTLLNGNYWEDYIGGDVNGDGIGDTPYSISGGDNNDEYPLMHEFEKYYILSIVVPSQVNKETQFTVTIKSDGGTRIGGASVTFNGDAKITPSNGQVTFIAPSVTNATPYQINATKMGYAGDTTTITVVIPSSTPPPSGGLPEFMDETNSKAPKKPTIEGPTEGYINVAYTYTANTTDADDHSIRYNFSWGDGTYTGWTNPVVDSGTPISRTHKWTSPGTYNVKVAAQDAIDVETSEWSDSIIMIIIEYGNDPPEKPSIPIGPIYGCANISYYYSTITTDSNGDKIRYRFDWGNGNISDWTQLVESGKSITVEYKWFKCGNYSIKSQAKDSKNKTSTWSDSLTVMMELDSDGDGWSDNVEKSYGTNFTDPNGCPLDTDGDGTPDDGSPDGKYQGDTDDDNDGLEDAIELQLGSDPKNESDVVTIDIEDISYYLLDTNKDGLVDTFYNLNNKKSTKLGFEDGEYLIDINGDGKWDSTYNPASKEVKAYEEKSSEEFPWLFVFIGIVTVAIVIVGILYFAGYIHMEKEYINEKPEEDQLSRQQFEVLQSEEYSSGENTSEKRHLFDDFKN